MQRNAIIRMMMQRGLLMMAFPSLSIAMAPDLKNNDKYGFTDHAKMRIIGRNISPEDVLETIKHGSYRNGGSKTTRLYFDNKKGIHVIVNTKSKSIITAYPTKSKQLHDDFDVKSQGNIKELKSLYCSLLKLSSTDDEKNNQQTKKVKKKQLSEIKIAGNSALWILLSVAAGEKNNVTREEFRQARLDSLLTAKKANDLMALIGSNTYQSDKNKATESKFLDYKLRNEVNHFNYYKAQKVKTEKAVDNKPLNQGNYEKKSKLRPITLAEYFPKEETE